MHFITIGARCFHLAQTVSLEIMNSKKEQLSAEKTDDEWRVKRKKIQERWSPTLDSEPVSSIKTMFSDCYKQELFKDAINWKTLVWLSDKQKKDIILMFYIITSIYIKLSFYNLTVTLSGGVKNCLSNVFEMHIIIRKYLATIYQLESSIIDKPSLSTAVCKQNQVKLNQSSKKVIFWNFSSNVSELFLFCDLWAHSNSAVNFIIYGYTHKGFHRAYKIWLQKFCFRITEVSENIFTQNDTTISKANGPNAKKSELELTKMPNAWKKVIWNQWMHEVQFLVLIRTWLPIFVK